MLILGIETSCDETAVALLDLDPSGKAKILAEEISSQSDIHEQYGGVVPELAAREHLRNLPLLVDQVLSTSGIRQEQVELVGVTRGPGLKGCLLIGVGFAKGFCFPRNIPLIGVNHIEGHVLAPLLDNPQLQYPFLALIVSGGHTEIVDVQGLGKYELVARTTDDAAGEAFDKSAHLLGFPYPGGPRLAAAADTRSESSFKLPKVMREAPGFSFSGLKTAISLLVKQHAAALKAGDEKLRSELSYSIQDSILDALLYKVDRALKERGRDTLVITGGVSRNQELRKRANRLSGAKQVFFPLPTHCMDNAAMIAYTAGLRWRAGVVSDDTLEIVSRWPIESMNLAQS